MVRQPAVPLPVIIIRDAARFVRTQDHQLLPLVLVQIPYGIADVIGAKQHFRAAGPQGINLQHLLCGSLPAHGQFLAAIPVQIRIIDAVNGSSASLDQIRLLIGVTFGGKNINLQRLFIRRITEKRQGLLPAIAIQIHQLHRLDIRTGGRRGILRAAAQYFINAVVQFRVFDRQGGQGIQVLRAGGQPGQFAAAGQRQRHQYNSQHRYQPSYQSSHCLLLPSADMHNSTNT